MRWSELMAKECIDLTNGERRGDFTHADLKIQPSTGKIETILIPQTRSWFQRKGPDIEFRWQAIQIVGSEFVIIDTRRRNISP